MSKPKCAVEDNGEVCGRLVVARGYCSTHYARWQRWGDPALRRRPTLSCTAEVNGRPCSQPHLAKGFCHAHYRRWKRWGSPLGEPLETNDQRFFAKIFCVPDGCWYWLGARRDGGYGQFRYKLNDEKTRQSPGAGRSLQVNALAHRLSYELWVGPIPENHELDHTCSTPSCVNPDHLEPVLPRENKRRAVERRRTKP